MGTLKDEQEESERSYIRLSLKMGFAYLFSYIERLFSCHTRPISGRDEEEEEEEADLFPAINSSAPVQWIEEEEEEEMSLTTARDFFNGFSSTRVPLRSSLLSPLAASCKAIAHYQLRHYSVLPRFL